MITLPLDSSSTCLLINSRLLVHDITFAVAAPNFAVFSPLGADEAEYDGEASETCAKNESDANIHDNIVKECEEEHPYNLLPSSDISRFACQQSRFCFKLCQDIIFHRPSTQLLLIFRHKCYGSSPLAVDPPKFCTSPKTSNFFDQPKTESLQSTAEKKTPTILRDSSSETLSLIPASPNSKMVSPHHVIGSSTPRYRSWRSTLRSALSFPSVTPPREH